MILVMMISILFGKRFEVISRGCPYSSYSPVLMAVVLKAVTMVVMLLILLTALLALFNAEVETELEGGGVIQKQCVARVSVEILPREESLAVIPDSKPEMQTMIQTECLLVLVNIWGVFSSVFVFFL